VFSLRDIGRGWVWQPGLEDHKRNAREALVDYVVNQSEVACGRQRKELRVTANGKFYIIAAKNRYQDYTMV
jgi:hypothetical protein